MESLTIPGLKNCEQRYFELMVSDKFEGLGGKWWPVYIPVLVPKEMVPEFESVVSRSRHAVLLDEDAFNSVIDLWNGDALKATEKGSNSMKGEKV